MPKREKKVMATSPVRMKQLGKLCSQLWYTREQYDIVKRAANIERRPMARFALHAAVKEAIKVLAEFEEFEQAGKQQARKRSANET